MLSPNTNPANAGTPSAPQLHVSPGFTFSPKPAALFDANGQPSRTAADQLAKNGYPVIPITDPTGAKTYIDRKTGKERPASPGKRPTLSEWEKCGTPHAVAHFSPGNNLGIRMGAVVFRPEGMFKTVGFDVDFPKGYENEAEFVRELLRIDNADRLIRIGNAPKFLALRSVAITDGASCDHAWERGSGDNKETIKLQVLGQTDGAGPKQFVAFGRHPDRLHETPAGCYEWFGGSPLDTAAADVPVVSLPALLDMIDKGLAASGWTRVNARRDIAALPAYTGAISEKMVTAAEAAAVKLIAEIASMADGTGRGGVVHNFGLRHGIVARARPDLLDRWLAELPGEVHRDLARGCEASLGQGREVKTALASAELSAAVAAQTASGFNPTADNAPDDGPYVEPPREDTGADGARDVPAKFLALIDEDHTPVPCENIQRITDASMAASRRPFRKFSEFNTVVILGGALGRAFRTSCGMSTALYGIMAAGSAIGKGESAGALIELLEELGGGFVSRSGYASRQGLHMDVQSRGGHVLQYRAEAGADVRAIAGEGERSSHEDGLRDAYYDLYDISNQRGVLAPHGSRAGQKAGDRKVYGVSFGLLWLCTPTVMRESFSLHAVETGFGSRILPLFHEGDAGPANHKPAPIGFMVRIALTEPMQRVAAANAAWANLAAIYEQVADAAAAGKTWTQAEADFAPQISAARVALRMMQVTVGYDAEAARLAEAMDDLAAAVSNDVAAKRLPPQSLVFARVGMLAKKVAAINAIMRDPAAPPVITHSDMAWGLAYTVECVSGLVAAFSNGDMGAADETARETAIGNWLRENFQRNKASNGWMAMRDIKKRAAMNKAFSDKRGTAYALLAERTLESMVRASQLETRSVTVGKGQTRTDYRLMR